MWTDGDIEELISFAEKIGLKRIWLQNHSKLIHYDLTESKRKLAIKNGAIELTRKESVAQWRERSLHVRTSSKSF